MGEFKTKEGRDSPVALSPLPGMASCYVTSPVPPPEGVLTADLTTTDPLSTRPQEKEVTSCKVFQISHRHLLRLPGSARVGARGYDPCTTQVALEFEREVMTHALPR